MPRKTTGGLMIRRRKDGRQVYALRFRALGKRQCITLGTSAEGWSRARAEEELENVLGDVRRGIWVTPWRGVSQERPPHAEPTFHAFAAQWFCG
jgi:hypothetical protein